MKLLTSRHYQKIGIVLFFLLFFNVANSVPKSLPSGAIGAANLIPGFGVNLTGSLLNQPFFSPATANGAVQLLSEFHFVTLGNSGYSAATYQNNYASCGNGGYFVGPVVQITPAYLYYFCLLPVYPWYLSAIKPIIYNGSTSSYYAEQQGLISWTNPNLPAGSGVTEQISTNALYKNGITATTFMLSNCDPTTTTATLDFNLSEGGVIFDGDDPFTFSTNGVAWQSVALTVQQGSYSVTSPTVSVSGSFTSNTSYNGYSACTVFASVTAAVLPNTSVTISASFSGLGVVASQSQGFAIGTGWTGSTPINADDSLDIISLTSNPYNPANYTGTLDGSSPSSNTCTSSFSLSPSQVGQPLYVTCTSSSTTSVSTSTPSATDIGYPTW